MAKQIRLSRRKAYAKGYLTGRDHYRQIEDSSRFTVRGSARRGYRKGLADAHREYKQRKILKGK